MDGNTGSDRRAQRMRMETQGGHTQEKIARGNSSCMRDLPLGARQAHILYVKVA